MSNLNENFSKEQIELKELIEKTALEEGYQKIIDISISTEFYQSGWVTIKFNKMAEWDYDNNQFKFLTTLQEIDRYNELVDLFGMPPVIDYLDLK